MITRKPKSVRSSTDDQKLAIIEHLTGERLTSKGKSRKSLACILHSFVRLAVYTVICVTIFGIAFRMIAG